MGITDDFLSGFLKTGKASHQLPNGLITASVAGRTKTSLKQNGLNSLVLPRPLKCL